VTGNGEMTKPETGGCFVICLKEIRNPVQRSVGDGLKGLSMFSDPAMAIGNCALFTLEVNPHAEQRGTQTITSPSDQQKSVPVVTVESFYNSHAEKLLMKLEGRAWDSIGRFASPPSNRPGLALSWFLHLFRGETGAGAWGRLNILS